MKMWCFFGVHKWGVDVEFEKREDRRACLRCGVMQSRSVKVNREGVRVIPDSVGEWNLVRGDPEPPPEPCPECHGYGRVPWWDFDNGKPCTECD